MQAAATKATGRTLLELRDVRLALGGRPVLDGISAEFWEGQVHALIGPNGAGKTTLAAAIMGLQGYTGFEGDILFEGQSLRPVSVDARARRGITLAWQEPARFEGLAVRAFLAAGAKDKRPERLAEALVQVGLEPAAYLRRAVDKTLSGGERKRIELASIIVMEPRLVLMDEPDSGIDIEALDRIFEAIRFLNRRGSTVILITHSLAVLKQADHAFLLCSGRLVDHGSVRKIGRYFEGKCLTCATADALELKP